MEQAQQTQLTWHSIKHSVNTFQVDFSDEGSNRSRENSSKARSRHWRWHVCFFPHLPYLLLLLMQNRRWLHEYIKFWTNANSTFSWGIVYLQSSCFSLCFALSARWLTKYFRNTKLIIIREMICESTLHRRGKTFQAEARAGEKQTFIIINQLIPTAKHKSNKI